MLRPRSVKIALLSAGLCALCAVASCSQDGVTTNCPARPIYQTFPLGDASLPDASNADSAAVKDSLAESVSTGCATGPSGVGAPVGGSSGTAGGGATGNAGEGGSTSADSAGAAGRN